jgi:hypothetical protein
MKSTEGNKNLRQNPLTKQANCIIIVVKPESFARESRQHLKKVSGPDGQNTQAAD